MKLKFYRGLIGVTLAVLPVFAEAAVVLYNQNFESPVAMSTMART